MKNLIKNIAVLATAALMVASASAQNYSPATLPAHIGVAVDATTHVQVTPASLVQIMGFNGDITNSLSPTTTGTNFVISPIAPYLFINASNAINLSHTTNKLAGTAWSTKVEIRANVADRALTYPATWNWLTNSAQSIVSGTPTNTIIIGKLTICPSNTITELEITAVGTNVLVGSRVFRP